MARRRFFVDRIEGDQAVLRGDDAAHLSRVLRAAAGQTYEISDNRALYLAEIREVAKDRVVFRVLQPLDAALPPVRIFLYAALFKFDRFEWLVEKTTELGVEAILPVDAARTEKGLCEAASKRVERWRKIARESSQQSRRVRLPEIHAPLRFSGALAGASGRRYFLDEAPGTEPLALALPPENLRDPHDEIALLSGPEGGWTDEERRAAGQAGWIPVSLGPQILRAETAAVAAVALLANAWLVSGGTL